MADGLQKLVTVLDDGGKFEKADLKEQVISCIPQSVSGQDFAQSLKRLGRKVMLEDSESSWVL